jgi:hypothetical protein
MAENNGKTGIEEALGLPILKDRPVKDYGTIGEGEYKAAIGKVYADETKTGISFHVIEMILISQTLKGEGGKEQVNDIMLASSTNNGVTLSFRKRKDGSPVYENVILKVPFWDIDEAKDSQGNKQFKTRRQCELAKVFKALDKTEAGDIIRWSKILLAAGRIVSFNLEKNVSKDKRVFPPQLNIDTLVDTQERVPLDNIVELYKTIKELTDEASSPKSEEEPQDAPF